MSFTQESIEFNDIYTLDLEDKYTIKERMNKLYSCM